MSERGEYSAGPQLVPARMLNELVYCQRLFHLEWVDGRWAHNDDTVQGSVAHDATDRRSGRMPAPDEEEKPFTSIQVALSDPDLGVTAVIDRVDHEDGSSSPVDMKKGSGPGDGGMWPADRVQVLTQAVLLRRAGYSVNRAEISYLGSHHRASIDVGPDAEMEVRELVALARKVAAQELPPPPLLNDPRCPRCSLAPLCMPDETNYLLERSSAQPRRIIVKNPDTRPVYVNTQGASVKVSGGRLLVAVKGETVAERRLLDVSQVCVVGNVQITTQALKALWRRGVVLHQPRYGRPALALDLAEEFRALVAESVALQCFNNGEINEKSFMRGHLGVVLTADGRRSVIQAHERRLDMELKHPLFGYQVSYRRVLDLQARVLAASFTGELDSYTPLMTR